MSLLRRHRTVRDVPEGDVITQTEPETDAEGGTESTVGETDQPTGENPTPEPETVADPEAEAEDDGEDAEAGEEPADEDDEGLAVVVTSDGVEHVGILPASAAADEDEPQDEAPDDEPQPEAKPRKRAAR